VENQGGVAPSGSLPLPTAPTRPATATGHDNDGNEAATQMISRPLDVPARPASRRTLVVVIAFVALAAGGIAVAMKVRGGSSTAPSAAAVAPSEQAQPAAPQPTVTQLPDTEPEPAAVPDAAPAAAPAAAAASSIDAAPPPAPAADAGPRAADRDSSSRKTRSPRDRRKAEPPAPPPEPELSAAEVQSRFRAVKREYNQFKKEYGARLEAEWNDLASLATFGQGPEKLKTIDREIKKFRAKMRAARGD
jgi:hypothetical protein